MVKFKDFFILFESLREVYPYSPNFNKSIRNGEYVFEDHQEIEFRTSIGNCYKWTADEHPHFKGAWTIVFVDQDGRTHITGSGDAFKVISTVVDITNKFIDSDKNGQVKMLLFTSNEPSRTKLYTKRLKLIKNFELLHEPETLGDRTNFILKRI